MPNINIKKSVYAMSSVDNDSAEIVMYGDIYESRPTDWYGDPIEGQFITLDEFLADLKQIEGCKNITIRMNSYGGDAAVGNFIHNRLRELARDGAKLTCIVDGVAMSAGSLIMCACDTVKANPTSLIMVHKCWCFFFGGYNADELRQAADAQDAWDKMQVEVYKRKTGLSETVLMHMMSNTTYMTGREAVEKGFADELIEDAKPATIAASADGRSLFVNGYALHLAPGMFAPDNIPTAKTDTEDEWARKREQPNSESVLEANTNTPAVTGNEKGGNSMTTKELREQYPEQVAEVEAAAIAGVDNTEAIKAAVQAERDRLAAIDEVADLFAKDVVREAKYGEKPITAQEMAYNAAISAAKKGSAFMAAAEEDAENSGAAKVGENPAGDDAEADTPEAKMEKARADVKKALGLNK